ncbi:DUF4832 domain-containing protein [Microlunatus soli]|uniref:DUF4832 domain-containing protein n=1 Tax=Microlunatus soli TaxID=630515 RepID=UPI0012FA612E|nr:DUF4832 domain-containing protein [Microlunatus soli]
MTADTTRVLKNPLSGWVLYGSTGVADDYWQSLDDLAAPVRIQGYANTLYLRIAWSVLNPAEDVYGWNTDDKLKSLIDTARQRGMKLAFRVVTDSRDKATDFTPSYVRGAGAQGYQTQTGSHTVWTAYPDDPIFRAKYEKFLIAFAAEFNDPEVVDFMDGYGLGKWGEGHSLIYLDDANREEVFRWNIGLWLRLFDKVPVAVNYHRFIGWHKPGDPPSATTGWGSPAPGSLELLTWAFEQGCSLRHDAFGMTTYYGQWERDLAAAWKFRRPVIMEGGWITGSHSYTDDPRGYQTPRDVRQGEYDDSAEGHVNTMDFRVGNETLSWFNDAPDLIDAFTANGSYRLYPDTLSLPTVLHPGAAPTIVHRWSNDGWGYCPNNLPQWGYRYKPAFALLDEDLTVVATAVDRDAEPSVWLRGTSTEYRFTPKIDNVPGGRYQWGVAVVDTGRSDTPGLELAAEGRVSPSGWLLVGDCTVG